MTTQDEPTTQGGTMPLLEHLTELRNRLGCLCSGVCYSFHRLPGPAFGAESQNIADIVYLFLQKPLRIF